MKALGMLAFILLGAAALRVVCELIIFIFG
jgi:hypothetical protein